MKSCKIIPNNKVIVVIITLLSIRFVQNPDDTCQNFRKSNPCEQTAFFPDAAQDIFFIFIRKGNADFCFFYDASVHFTSNIVKLSSRIFRDEKSVSHDYAA